MLKDYYKILDISLSATAYEIKTAYREQSMKWHPDRNPNVDTTSIMQDINEAYNILKNADSRARYDNEYENFFNSQKVQPTYEESGNEYDIKDEELKQDIHKARTDAEDFVRNFMQSLRQDSGNAVRGAWDGIKFYVIAAIILSVIGMIFLSVSKKPEPFNPDNEPITYPDWKAPSKPVLDTIVTTCDIEAKSWKKHIFFNAISILVPPTIELRDNSGKYKESLSALGVQDNIDAVVFNQKGLNDMEQQAYEKYCRIMLTFIPGEYGDFFNRNETEKFSEDDVLFFGDMVESEIGSKSSVIGGISYKWIRVNNANGILLSYKRTGNNFDSDKAVVCKLVLFQDNSRMVKMVLSYRENEANLWKDDFDNVLSSFKWID